MWEVRWRRYSPRVVVCPGNTAWQNSHTLVILVTLDMKRPPVTLCHSLSRNELDDHGFRALVGLFSAHCCSARLRSSTILGGALWGVVPGGSEGPSRPSAASAPAPSGRACGWKGIRWSWSILDVSKSAVTPPPPHWFGGCLWNTSSWASEQKLIRLSCVHWIGIDTRLSESPLTPGERGNNSSEITVFNEKSLSKTKMSFKG